MFSLTKGYNKVNSPFTRVSYLNKTIVTVPINVSLRLLKMMGIDERENTIDLQFEITLEWRDLTFKSEREDIPTQEVISIVFIVQK